MSYDCRASNATNEETTNVLADIINSESRILPQVSDSDVFFAKERLCLHKATPEEGVSLQVLKNYIQKKYGI